MPSSSHPRRVALAFPVSVPWLALCMQGIVDYSQQQGGWDLLTSPPTSTGTHETALTAESLIGWPGDGIIAAVSDEAEARYARQLEIPMVNLAATIKDLPFPRVMVDHYAIGRLAAEHLLHRGFYNLGFYGFHDPWYASERRRGFHDRATEAGVACELLEQPVLSGVRLPWHERYALLNQWLKNLPLPIGIFAVHDYHARILIDECNSLGLKVPLDVAVLGTDNDTIVCEHCQPTLSSVARNPRENGYQAAALLDQIMAGKKPKHLEVVIPPENVVERGSTDTVVVKDAHVRTVVYYMRNHFREPIDIEQISLQVSISRRLLEKRFRKSLDCTPHEYLCQLRTDEAKKLLVASPRMKIHSIARLCGFTSQDHMRLVFLRLLGMTPRAYRDVQGS